MIKGKIQNPKNEIWKIPYLSKKENLFLNEIKNKICESDDYTLENIDNGKFIVSKLESKWMDDNTKIYYARFEAKLTISVWCKGKKKVITVWDSRENQPFFESEYCDYEGSFGRYQFPNFEEFWNHLTSDYGVNWYENPKYKVNEL
jgi:hypothetical protein